MPLENITPFTIKGAAINELQSLKKDVLAGTTAATNIALAGATVKRSTVKSVLAFNPLGPSFADLTAEASIASDGNLQLSTTDTTGQKLIVEWYDKPAQL